MTNEAAPSRPEIPAFLLAWARAERQSAPEQRPEITVRIPRESIQQLVKSDPCRVYSRSQQGEERL